MLERTDLAYLGIHTKVRADEMKILLDTDEKQLTLGYIKYKAAPLSQIASAFLTHLTQIALTLAGLLSVATLTGCGSAASSSTAASSSSTENSEPKTELVFANYRDIRDPNPHLYQGEMWFQEIVCVPLTLW